MTNSEKLEQVITLLPSLEIGQLSSDELEALCSNLRIKLSEVEYHLRARKKHIHK